MNTLRIMDVTKRKALSTLRYALPAVMAAALLSACGTTTTSNQAADKVQDKHDPVTINIGVKKSGYLTDEEFSRFIAEPVKKKYSWITCERILYDDKLLPDMVASNQTPDIIITNNVNGMPAISEMNLLQPMTDQIKKNNIDLSRFQPETLEAVKAAAQSNDLVAIPYTQNFTALYYNKDLFDKFGVPYPKDGMTWKDATELARRMTRMEDGVQYRGLEPNVPERMGSQLSLPFVDVKTNKALINTDMWKTVLQQAADIYQIPGNTKYAWKTGGQNLFIKDRTLAMLADVNIITTAKLDQFPDLNWDMASYPVFQEAPGKGTGPDLHIMVPTSTSQHKDDVYRIISTVISDDVQLDMAKQGRTSVLTDDKFKKAFGQDLPVLKGKNIAAAFKTTLAKPYQPSLYDTLAMSALQGELKNMIKGKDVNSALRDAEEKLNKDIEAKQQ